MKFFNDLSIKVKLTMILLFLTLVSGAVAGSVLVFYDLALFRKDLIRNLSTLAQVIGNNSTAALAFDSVEDSESILASLRFEPSIVAARIFRHDGAKSTAKTMATYVRPGSNPTLPDHPERSGIRFEADRLVHVHTIAQDDSPQILGSLYIEADLSAVQKRVAVYQKELLLMLSTCALMALALMLYLNKSISMPLRQIATAAGSIASGKLSVNLPPRRRSDEMGTLIGAFERMVTTLREQTEQLVTGTNILASSSSEISTSTSQLSANAAETTAVVQRTASTVAEVKHTAEVAHQRAEAVADSAISAVRISEEGRRSVKEMLAVVERIRDQIDKIADRTVHLSAQSHTVTEITGTVNDLAEQSKLLAVNAAIEAARSGEQGKAFAVVANEVKNLADQSKRATTQVRGILDEIQKSVGAVAMATESGSKEAAIGVRQSASVEDAIQKLSESIQNAADMGQQIAASSKEQVAGMEQVKRAMENIETAAHQTLNGSKQVESVARDLDSFGKRIKQITDKYSL